MRDIEKYKKLRDRNKYKNQPKNKILPYYYRFESVYVHYTFGME
jgi:hypothetical protein